MSARDARVGDRQDGSPRAALSPTTFGLRATSKIQDRHLDRLAIVYVRQSSPQQVLENRESRERQYALAQFAQRLGWPAERVVIVDEDQGRSGKSADHRSGFQRLMTEVSLNHVGIVLGLELCRLSRSNKDWHQLIDVCGIFNTLLCDQDGVYDPLDGNDRLLLGMRGAMNEFELVTLRNRLLRGSRNKAERGELFLAVPLGYFKTPSGEIVQEPDEQARGMIQLVFEKFEELGSAYAVFRYLVVNGLHLGFRRHREGRIGELEWKPPSPTRILSILRHPIYAGAYAYGLHRAGTKNPVTGHIEGGKWFVPPAELPVLLQDRLPAYISWDRYLANQERLEQNRSLRDTRGVPKRGEALLPGLVVCSKCGHRMTTRYKAGKRPSYYCGEYWRLALDEPCGHISAATVDDLVAREVLHALEPAALDLSLRAIENVEQERKRLHNQWRQTLERAQHDVARAERQYHAVEPENRLVARTLESRWEDALQKLRQTEEDYHRFLVKLPPTLSGADRQRIQSLSESVATLWHAPGTSALDRKQIVRCLVERVIVAADKSSELNEVTIVWQGGIATHHQVARPVGTYAQLRDFRRLTERITQLHHEGLHLAQIAERLNDEGFVPPRRRGVFSEAGIGSLVRDLGLVGELFRDDLVGKDEWWIPDLARGLGVIPQKVHYWVKQEWVHSRRTPSGKHLIVWADKDEIRRLRQLAKRKSSWIAARHPELVVPKGRPAR
ncbi:MAG TPA: recombinase family protein [Isosphaeraceae bacterium]|nr:recombinase family protein [Isosphaeraceae bacterium]